MTMVKRSGSKLWRVRQLSIFPMMAALIAGISSMATHKSKDQSHRQVSMGLSWARVTVVLSRLSKDLDLSNRQSQPGYYV